MAALALPFLLLAGCSEEEKKPVVSANLCLYFPSGMVLGPYDTKEACAKARENMPAAQCRVCEKPPGPETPPRP